jgi:P4 family phage/plasmid primase-like protien
MLEIVTANNSQIQDEDTSDTPIYEVFDRYNEYYYLEDIHKKCIIYKTNCNSTYLYLFPSLPDDERVLNILVQDRSYNPQITITTSNSSNNKIFALENPISVYPRTFDIQVNVFDFLQCKFHLEIIINELTIEKARYICSNLQVIIKERKNKENIFSKFIVVPTSHNSHSYKNEINANIFDLDSIWEKKFLPEFPENTNKNYTRLEIECKLKNSNNLRYNTIKDHTNALYAICCIHETEYSISRLFCEIFQLSFICSNYEKKIINFFENNRWHTSDGGICIKKAIISDFPKKLLQLKYKYNELKEIVERICFTIQNQSFRNKMFNDCCEILYDKNFYKKTNPKGLISFSNGVYDIELGKLRSGVPSDYVILSTNLPYEIFESKSPAMEALMDFLQKVFPVENIMKYFIRFLSACLEGGNKEKIFSIWSGLGDNGKSVLVNLISLAFGEYSVKLPTSLISGKRTQSAGATPELTMLENMLLGFLQEPDEEKMNPALIKEFTGNDTIYVRGLYEKGRNIEIKARFVLIANRIPQLGIADKAAWNRIRVIPFLSTFVDNLEEKDENKQKHLFKKDTDFSRNLHYLAPTLMYLLTEEYKNYKAYGLEEPEEIKKYTQELKTINDPLEQFINSNIDVDPKGLENIKELYENYKVWFKNMFPTSKVLDISNFSRELKKRDFTINSLDQILGIKILEHH